MNKMLACNAMMEDQLFKELGTEMDSINGAIQELTDAKDEDFMKLA